MSGPANRVRDRQYDSVTSERKLKYVNIVMLYHMPSLTNDDLHIIKLGSNVNPTSAH